MSLAEVDAEQDGNSLRLDPDGFDGLDIRFRPAGSRPSAGGADGRPAEVISGEQLKVVRAVADPLP